MFTKSDVKKSLNMVDLDKITYNDKTKQYEYKDDSLVVTFDKISNHLTDTYLIEE